ncbi:MAG: HIG1 domain-containing protein, partial [Pacificimonas sp.]
SFTYLRHRFAGGDIAEAKSQVKGMNGFVIFLIVAGALATAAVLIRGIIVMASGKDLGGKKSNKLMFTRVYLQAGTIIFIVVLAMMAGAFG